MLAPPARHCPKPDRRHALELLADCPQEGCTKESPLTRGRNEPTTGSR